MKRLFASIIDVWKSILEESGSIMLMFLTAVAWAFIPPFRFRLIIKQMHFVGVRSFWVVVITGAFTGMVFALQIYYVLHRVAAESVVGSTVALAICRELGPVLTGLIVTGRAGSAIAAELGTMRVTEQVDALEVMGVHTIQYLVTPRIIAGALMLPLLVALADFIGTIGAYFVGVDLLGINSGMFMAKIYEYVDLEDIGNGLIKASFFGCILALIGCYKGYNTRGGAEGVGRATTESVVMASLTILISDFIITAVMF